MTTLPNFEFTNATSGAEAVTQLSKKWNDAMIYAGGTDMLDLMKERIYEPKKLVNIKTTPELKFVKSESDGSLRIGPLMTLAEIADHPEISKEYPVLSRACGKAATVQIRNLATIGGNICQRPRCWYFRSEDFPCLRKGGSRCYAKEGENKYHAIFTEDEPCVIVHPSAAAVGLVALDASLKVIGKDGERTVPLEKFFLMPHQNVQRENVLEPNELITEIIIPATSRGWKSAYIKQREKQSYDWPLADVGIAAKVNSGTIEQARVVLGSAAPVPYRAEKAEEFLKGKALNPETAAKAGELAVEGATPLSQNEYKVHLFKVIVRRTLLALNETKVS